MSAWQRHARAPISELSDDILRIIFNLCCEDVAHEDATACAEGLAKVCARWYAVARDNAAMWSRFNLSGITDQEAKTFFRLSRGHKKRIMYGNPNVAVRDDIVELLSQHMESVVQLDLNVKDETSGIALLKASIPSAPILHTFSLRLSESPYTPQHRIFPDFPAFVCKTPNVRHFTLEGLRAPWIKECHRNLTTLRLSNCVLDAHPLDEGIFSTLHRSPHLQELWLEMSCRTNWRPATDRLMNLAGTGGRKVSLKSLRVLHLSLPHPYLFYLLRGIDVSQSVQVLDFNVVDYEAHFNMAAPSRIFHPNSMSLDILAGARSARLELRDGDMETIEFFGGHPEGHCRRRVSWKHRAAGRKCPQVLNTLIEHHPQALALIESFELVSHENSHSKVGLVMPHNLPTLVGRLTNLVSLKLGTTDHNQLLPRISRFRLPRLVSFSIATSSLQPLPAIRIGWLPSLYGNCPELKHFDVTFNPQSAQETLGGPFLRGAAEVDVELAREELEAIARAHTNISVRGYAYVRTGEDGLGEPQLTQIWPMAEKKLA